MTLIKQLWIAISLCMALAFGGSLVLNILSTRNYLQQQLQVKNIDNATALALSLSQLPKDPVTVELQLAAQFDVGHYRFIRIVSPTGEVLAERTFEGKVQEAPAWFVGLIPIKALAGQALVQDGWKQYGVLSLASHEQYAYQSLWNGTLELLAWFVAGGLLTGVVVTLIMRAIAQPLNNVVIQANAIAEHRFIQIPEPSAPELRSVVRAMNSLVERLKQMFGQEATRLEALRQRINTDAVTGLSSREHFVSQLMALSTSDDAGAGGSLLMLRLNDLERFNREIGYQRVDTLLKSLAAELQHDRQEFPGMKVGRLNGSDFAVAYPGGLQPRQVAADLHQRLRDNWLPQWPGETASQDIFHMAAVGYQQGQRPSDLMSRADQALAHAKGQGPNSLYVVDAAKGLAYSGDEWRLRLTKAVAEHELKLAFSPVRRINAGALDAAPLLHQEAMVRWLDRSSQPPVAVDCVPMAAHLRLGASVDLEVANMVLTHLRSNPGALAMNLSPQSLVDFRFRNKLFELLQANTDLCSRLLFEVHEYGVSQHFDAFCDIAKSLKALGCGIGINYFSHSLAQGSKLAELNPDYIKVDPSYLFNLAENSGNQEYLKGLCAVALPLGMKVVALGVKTQDEWQLLEKLGFHGAAGMADSSGPAIT